MTTLECRAARRAAGKSDVCLHVHITRAEVRQALQGMWLTIVLTILFMLTFGVDWRFAL